VKYYQYLAIVAQSRQNIRLKAKSSKHYTYLGTTPSRPRHCMVTFFPGLAGEVNNLRPATDRWPLIFKDHVPEHSALGRRRALRPQSQQVSVRDGHSACNRDPTMQLTKVTGIPKMEHTKLPCGTQNRFGSGTRNADITISDSAPDSPQMVPLTGIGVGGKVRPR